MQTNQSKLITLARVARLVTLLGILGLPGFADTIISNYPQLPAGFAGFFYTPDSLYVAAGFRLPAGDNYLLDSATLRLQFDVGTASIAVQLFADGGAGPVGPALLTFSNPALSFDSMFHDVTFTSTSPFTLLANTSYWIIPQSTHSPGGSTLWSAGEPALTQFTGIGTSIGYLDGQSFPPTQVITPYAPTYRVDGTSTSNIPEPTTLATLGLGLVILLVRSQTRHSAPASTTS